MLTINDRVLSSVENYHCFASKHAVCGHDGLFSQEDPNSDCQYALACFLEFKAKQIGLKDQVLKHLNLFKAISWPRPLPLIGNIWRYLSIVGDYNVDDSVGDAKIN